MRPPVSKSEVDKKCYSGEPGLSGNSNAARLRIDCLDLVRPAGVQGVGQFFAKFRSPSHSIARCDLPNATRISRQMPSPSNTQLPLDLRCDLRQWAGVAAARDFADDRGSILPRSADRRQRLHRERFARHAVDEQAAIDHVTRQAHQVAGC